MIVYIGCAKSMNGGRIPRLLTGCTEPMYQRNADSLAMYIARYSADELRAMLHCSAAIARENSMRYRRFLDPATRRPAVFSYDGMVYKKLDAEAMSDDELRYANEHLLIGSFLYGLLRPLDLINPYRLEGGVRLPALGDKTLFDYWKPIITDRFIEIVKADDGTLVNLASNEFREILDWRRVEQELRVISPEFLVEKDGRLRNVTVYAKMCRGAMAQMIIRGRLTAPEELWKFDYEGFAHEGDGYRFALR